MSKDNPNPEQPDPLSATGMFLRAFDVEGEKKPSDPFAPAPAASRPPSSASERPPYPPAAPQQQGAGQGPGHGEFTQMFNAQGQRPAPPPAQPATEAPTAVFRAPSYPSPPPAPNDQPPGEFTRIFVSGVTPPQAAPPPQRRRSAAARSPVLRDFPGVGTFPGSFARQGILFSGNLGFSRRWLHPVLQRPREAGSAAVRRAPSAAAFEAPACSRHILEG